MPDNNFDWGSLVLEERAELLLGWRPSTGRIAVGAVELSRDVATELGNACKSTLSGLASMRRRPYSEALALEGGEEFAALSTSELPAPKVAPVAPGTSGRRGSPRPDPATAEPDRQLSDLESAISTPGAGALSVDDVRGGRYLFYAAIGIQVGTGHRYGFVRQVDPHRVARQGFLTTIFGQEGLQRLDDPIFVFEEGFDVLVAPSEIAILRLESFNRLFADLAPIMAAAEPNARIVAAVLPTMDAVSVSALASFAATRASVARRLQRLARPGAMPTVSAQQLRVAMKKHGLDPRLLLTNSKIVFGEENVLVFLDMMEQLYYETDFG